MGILNVLSFVELQITNDVLEGRGGEKQAEELTTQNKQALDVSARLARLLMNQLDPKFCESGPELEEMLERSKIYDGVNENRRVPPAQSS